MCAWRVDQMVDDVSKAADTLNNAFEMSQAMSGKYPKEFIQKNIEQWYIDGNESYEYCENIIECISNRNYQKTALAHLNYIHKYGYVHRKLKTQSIEQPKSSFLENYFMALIWLPAMFGVFMLFSEDEENKKQGFGCLLAILTWALFIYWIQT